MSTNQNYRKSKRQLKKPPQLELDVKAEITAASDVRCEHQNENRN